MASWRLDITYGFITVIAFTVDFIEHLVDLRILFLTHYCGLEYGNTHKSYMLYAVNSWCDIMCITKPAVSLPKIGNVSLANCRTQFLHANINLQVFVSPVLQCILSQISGALSQFSFYPYLPPSPSFSIPSFLYNKPNFFTWTSWAFHALITVFHKFVCM